MISWPAVTTCGEMFRCTTVLCASRITPLGPMSEPDCPQGAGVHVSALCPGLIIVPPRFATYLAASRAVSEIFRDTAPVVEAMSIDEAFLDVRGLEHISGQPVQIAGRLRAVVRAEVGLPIPARTRE